MTSFKEEFKKQRAMKGSGATFEWKGKLYSTDTADGKKAAPAEPAPRPANLNPKSGASRSTAGKVAAKSSPTANRPAKPAEMSGQKPAPAKSGASRSTAGKVAPKMSMMDKAAADVKARREKSQASNKPKTPVAAAKTGAAYTGKIGPKKETNFEYIKRALKTKGGISKFKG